MRVISGSARGLRLISPEGDKTRPTLDRVKEAIFSMMLPYINGAEVLDLFAGSGALGIEALSRGAENATFVDTSKDAIRAVKTNVSVAKFDDKAVVLQSDAAKFIESCERKFDIIFLDPPYANGLYESTLKLISEKQILKEDGFIIIEQDFDAQSIINFGNVFEIEKEKKYGRVGITVLKWR